MSVVSTNYLLRWPRLEVSVIHQSGVRPSVPSFFRVAWRILNVTHEGAARDAASVNLRPSITRTDILYFKN